MTSETPATPITFKNPFINELRSMKDRVCLLEVVRSVVLALSILTVKASLGSRLTIFAYKWLISVTENLKECL